MKSTIHLSWRGMGAMTAWLRELEPDTADDARYLDAERSIVQATPSDLIAMWRDNAHWATRAPLSQHEYEALTARWLDAFNRTPPTWGETNRAHKSPEDNEDSASEITTLSDDAMLSIREVCRLTNLAPRAVMRMCSMDVPRFPKPIMLAENNHSWCASEVKAWLSDLELKRARR